MSKGVLPVLLTLFVFSTIYCQDRVNLDLDASNLFKALPSKVDNSDPEWVKAMYSDPYNFQKIEDLFRSYHSTHEFKKSLHTQNYKYWHRQVNNYVKDDGYVSFPDPGVEFRSYESQKQKSSARMNVWSCIGPEITYNGNGSLTSRPTQANVYCLGVAPSNPSVVYAGMETGGIFKTIDKGMNWYPVSYDYAIGNIQDIKVDPLDENIVYISRDKEVYKTIDGGTTWNLIYTSSGRVEQFFIHPTVTDTIYAATQNDILKSNDAGVSWTSVLSGRFYDIEFMPGTPSTIYVAKENTTLKRPEIWKTIDSGTTWVLKDNQFYVPSDLSEATVYGCKIGVTPADPSRIYAGIIATGKKGDNGWIGVYHSTDEGETWINQSGVNGATIYNSSTGSWEYPSGNDMNTNWFIAGYSSGYHQGFYNFDIDVSHNNPDRLWIGTIWFCESANKGTNIEYIRGTRSLEMHADIQDIDVVGNEIWVTSDGGINYSNDECQSMEVRMNGITASDFWGFGQGWNTDTWVGGRYHNGNGAYHENYGIGNSVFLGGAESATGYVHQFENKKTYCSDVGGKEIPESLTGEVKNIVNLSLYPNQSYYHFSYSEVEWHPNFGNEVYIGYQNGFYKSKDDGQTFSKLSDLPGELRRFEISRDDPNYIYAIVYFDYWDWRVYKSVDGGTSFTQLATPPYSSGSWRELSLTLNPFDKDEIWLASRSSSNDNKLFQSTDGGASWTNKYDVILANQGIKDMIYQSSDQGDVLYVLTNDNFFYHDINEDSWTQYNAGLPVLHTGFKMLPFYRDQKIRLASAKGIWEAPMIKNNKVQAHPMVRKSDFYCSRDTLHLESYSIVNHINTTYNWTITPTPSFISDPNIRNPKVVLGNDGSYDITLQVTQSDGQTDSKTISNVVSLNSQCEAERIPGLSFHGSSDADYFVAQDANLDSITHFTVTGWWKPDSLNAFGALFSSGDWCAHCDDTEALMVDYWGGKLWYKWPGNAANWGSNSGMDIPINEWSYVALVIEPTRATLYLNDDKFIHNIALDMGSITNFYIGRGHYNNSFWGAIDDVTIWKRALQENDIRRLRHLTKEAEIIADPDLIAYYQFNHLINENKVLDHAGTFHGNLVNGAQLIPSTAPIGGGISETFLANSSGIITSSLTGVEMEFPSNGTYPDGEVVISRIDLQPNLLPGTPASRSYWIINNYGPNKTFTKLNSMTFFSIGNVTPYNLAGNLYAYERDENDHNANWIIKGRGDVLGGANKDITYYSNLRVDSFGQFVIQNSNAKGWIGVVNTDWDNPGNWGNGIVPDEHSDVIIPKDAPFQPIVNVNATVRSLTIMEGASFGVKDGILFETRE